MEPERQRPPSHRANDTIGRATVAIELVRKRRNHSYSSKWVDLRDGQRFRGKLKISVVSYGAGDEPPVPGAASSDEEGAGDGKATTPGIKSMVMNQVQYGDDQVV